MTAVPRWFRYALEPVRQQRAWRLDAAQSRVAALQAQAEDCDARLRQAQALCSQEAGVAAHAWRKTGDPRAQAAGLAYLAQLHQHAEDLRREAASVCEQLSSARELCAGRQRDLEMLERHRDAKWRDELAVMQRREAAAADADWSARSAHGDEQ